MSNQMIAISDLGETLMILGLAAREMFLNSLIWLMKSVTLLLEILFPSDHRYGMSMIFR